MTKDETVLMEVSILRHDREAVFLGVSPDLIVIRGLQADIADVLGFREQVCELANEPM